MLSPLQDYRRRGARFSQNESHPLLAYKSRLHKSAEIQRSCCYPSCNKPIKWDPRWNGQYCSPSCVSEHCRLAFMDWCARKRLPLNAVVENHLISKADILENGIQRSRLETIDIKKESQSDLAVNSDKQCANDLSIHQTTEGSTSSYQPSDHGISVGSPSSVPNQVKPEEPPNDSGIMYRKSLFEALKNSTFSFPVATVRSNSNDGS
ncbi:hypothetical protein PHET_11203 [Paragonimus heterotremus]|uniref:Uncharacterized protein n=1 Tax=Paragonimus heterotremus TaxID=100268 RepID=A0A8J4T5S0_9TREM|nr:hypothetical protein PHET_11203 [Paragonimus heterotremus]